MTRYKLAEGATLVLACHLPADAPRNLRLMFNRAVETKESAPRLRIERLRLGLWPHVRSKQPMAPESVLADWLEELAVFGTTRRFQDAETAHHLSQAIRYWRLVRLATAHAVEP